MVVAQAGFSGIQANTVNIEIWYDDGRDISAAYDNNAATNGRPPEEIGWCDSTSETPNPKLNSNYTQQGDTAAASRPLQNGDRITVEVNVNVQFLTPFIKAFAPQGVTMDFKSSRSIFPNGL